ncbi:response regulator transcription factor [Paenibacillus sp. JX-17]|uniref:Response regulator transcription factor n=1 Tax=Paenibacillus lacisoli TaxID=3064525 RepID=A0ABT9CBH5_9BACL|nr:response regulator transcription factor [Paenibacillus sp. JX-17]MDO7906614.1 response regulator transcription factor [Paenibacillus sp. JX-17]
MISLLIVDDDPLIRESLKLILGMNPELEVAGTAGHGDEAEQLLLDGMRPDVILMDIRMPICDGVEGTRKAKAVSPDSKVLILTTFDDDDFIIEALRNGASGYLLKNIPPERIIQGIRTVHDGDMLIHPDIASKLAGLLRTPAPRPPAAGNSDYGLTPAEENIVTLISEGLSNKEIAARQFLSEGTVKNYITDILGKLNLRDRTQIAIWYWKQRSV